MKSIYYIVLLSVLFFYDACKEKDYNMDIKLYEATFYLYDLQKDTYTINYWYTKPYNHDKGKSYYVDSAIVKINLTHEEKMEIINYLL
jgi:hypothetical protein